MTIRFYILPVDVWNGMRGPKYLGNWGIPDEHPGYTCPWSMKDYGSINMSILAANISDADHVTLSANTDVYSFPVTLSTVMTVAQRQAMNTYLEAHGIPGDWLGAGDTFLYAARIVTGMMLYLQAVLGLIGYPSDPFAGLTLNTQYKNVPNPLHDAMQQGAVNMGYTWNVSANDQIRKIFKLMSDQWGAKHILFGFTTL